MATLQEGANLQVEHIRTVRADLEPPFAHSGAHLCFGGWHYTPWVGEGPKKMGVVPPAALSAYPNT